MNAKTTADKAYEIFLWKVSNKVWPYEYGKKFWEDAKEGNLGKNGDNFVHALHAQMWQYISETS